MTNHLHHLTFAVHAKPVTQGSMSPGKHGKMFHKKTLQPWRDEVLKAALKAAQDTQLSVDEDFPLPRRVPVTVTAVFYFRRPQNPTYDFPARADVDKLARAVGDALSVGADKVLTDDDQIVRWDIRKAYALEDGAVITLTWDD